MGHRQHSSFLISFVVVTTFFAGAMAVARSPALETVSGAAIAPQALDTALEKLRKQTGLQIIYLTMLTQGKTSNGAPAGLPVEQALMRVLEGTGLSYQWLDGKTVKVGVSKAIPKIAEDYESPLQGIQTDSGAQVALQEVVVTGSHIRGNPSSASPILRFDRLDIQRSGYATTEQFIQSLPQNFGGGNTTATATGIRGGEGSDRNPAQGTGVNLRGLGNDATLILLDGHRLAAAGVGNFVDLSMVPLDAVERIEVLTDGASAVYGSDAISGVVNLILRKNYSGAESRIRYGQVTSGDQHEREIGQLLGTEWASGSALISYNYFDQSRLSSEERFPLSAADPGFGAVDLVSPEKRQSVLASASQDLGNGILLFGQGLYSERNTRSSYFIDDDNSEHADVSQYGGMVGASKDLGHTWRMEVSGAYDRNNTANVYSFIGEPYAEFDSVAAVRSFDTKADGAVLALPGGSAKLAIGAHYRRESYDSRGTSLPSAGELSRNIRAIFGELLVPLVGEANRARGLYRLELTAAARYEKYSDFGSSSDPKIGLSWAPISNLNIRSTYGTSFKAPIFSQLDASVFSPATLVLPDPAAPGGATTTILIQGNNAALQPEKATTWTVGADFTLPSLPDTKISLTYYDINFEDRITTPVPFAAVFGGVVLDDPAYASFILRNPDASVLDALFADPRFRDFSDLPGGVTPADVGAIINDRVSNVARRKEQGLDFSASNRIELGGGALELSLAGTYLFKFEDQPTSTSSVIRLLNTVSWPVDLRVRGGTTFTRGGVSLSAFLNFVDGYRDVRPASAGTVSQWTTVDINLAYDTEARFAQTWLGGTTVALSVQNLFDRAPPFAQSLTPNGINFDATNASALGRFASLVLRKRW
jgi:outer membrane receptor protein involved in Fe transport